MGLWGRACPGVHTETTVTGHDSQACHVRFLRVCLPHKPVCIAAVVIGCGPETPPSHSLSSGAPSSLPASIPVCHCLRLPESTPPPGAA